MNKQLLAFGIIMCFLGLVLSYSSNISVKTTRLSILSSTIVEENQTWIYSVDFNSSKTVQIEIRGPERNPNIWWFNDFYDSYADSNIFWNPYAPVKLNVTLIHPDNVTTLFCVWFTWDYLTGLNITNLELLSEETGSLKNLSLKCARYRGIIKGNVIDHGIYRFRINKEYWMKVGAVFYPPELRFLEESIVDAYPYSNILPLGVGILSLGFIISTLGFVKKKRRRYKLKGK